MIVDKKIMFSLLILLGVMGVFYIVLMKAMVSSLG